MRKFQLFIIMIIGLAIFAGCENTNSDGPLGIANESSVSLMKTGEKSVMPQTITSTGTVTVIHGVPGLTVDVYINGSKTLAAFEPWTVTDPLQLPEGNYNIVIVPKGGNPANPAISGSAFLPAGANVSIIAHLTAAGSPTLTVFVNDVSSLKSGTGRLTVRHTAQAPAVDLRLYRGETTDKMLGVFTNLTNPNQITSDLRPGDYTVTLTPTGTSTVVYGPITFGLNPKRSTIFYAVGSISDGSFRILTQKINLYYGK
jgi:hypothetical protein